MNHSLSRLIDPCIPCAIGITPDVDTQAAKPIATIAEKSKLIFIIYYALNAGLIWNSYISLYLLKLSKAT
jgi:hypothetical protein